MAEANAQQCLEEGIAGDLPRCGPRCPPRACTPEQTVERGADLVGLRLPEDEEQKQVRESGLGSLLGALAGVGAGVTLGALRAATGRPSGSAGTVGAAWVLAMLAGNGPMMVLGVTDPRTWRPVDWAADVIPQLAYAVVAAAALDAFDTRG
jgi:hypothetical protein